MRTEEEIRKEIILLNMLINRLKQINKKSTVPNMDSLFVIFAMQSSAVVLKWALGEIPYSSSEAILKELSKKEKEELKIDAIPG